MRRWAHLTALAVLTAGTAAGALAHAQYDYSKGSGGSGGDGESGFVLLLEGSFVNPRNTDNVVATEIAGSSVFPIVPDWDEDGAARIGLGYEWANGNAVVGSYWKYEGDQAARGSATHGGVLAFAIGPPIATSGGYAGDQGTPGFFATLTEVSAETADLALTRSVELSESFSMEWSLGARYARFEEVDAALYDEASGPAGVNSYRARKTNEGKMIGARLAARGSYRLGSFSLDGGLGVSLLDGEVTASSGLQATGSGNQGPAPSLAILEDDGRSGSIRDFDVAAVWHAGELLELSLGWEQSEWRDIAADPLRSFPGTIAPLQNRDAVTFSGIRLGLRLHF